MDICEEGQREICGRYNYRQADLSYLLIDGERMFPLAELLASLFSNTARTTLFTRMEKIKTRRHFCSAEEIKLLKTVNGIHGSSAICTLIPEADVQKYCDVYIDRTVDIKLFSTSIRRSKVKNNISKIKEKTLSKGTVEKSNSKATNNDSKQEISSNAVSDKAAKTSKSRKDFTAAQKFKKGTKLPKVLKNSRENNHLKSLNNRRKGCHDPKSLASLAKLALNSTQLSSNRSGVTGKAKKKRKVKDLQDNDSSQTNGRQRKKAKHENDTRDEEGCLERQFNDSVSVNNTSQRLSLAKHQCGSSLSQCLTNANSEILFSDASSNDSGFASTTISESLQRKPNCLGLKNDGNYSRARTKAKNNNSLASSKTQGKSKRVRKGPKKAKRPKHVNKTLSPPALVLKRQNNVWQVETRNEQGEPSSCKSTVNIVSKAKKTLKWMSINNCPNQQKLQQNTTISSKKRKNNTLNKNGKANSQFRESFQNSVPKEPKRKISKVKVEIGNSSTSSDNYRKDEKSPQKGKKRFVAKTLKASKDFSFMNLFSSFPFLTVKDGDLSPSFSNVLPERSSTPPSTHPIWKWQRGRAVFAQDRKK